MPQLGIAAGPETFCQVAAELDFLAGNAGREGAHVGVEREQFRAFGAIQGDAFEHVDSGAAEADDLNGGTRQGGLGGAMIGNHGACWLE